jgi:FixJ family two-component response regulator
MIGFHMFHQLPGERSFPPRPTAGDDQGNVQLKRLGPISVIDDDVAVRHSTMVLLRSLGYVATAFASVEEFLSSDHRETSCVITDVRMPGMDGFDLQDRLKADGRGVPIIFITAFPEDPIRQRALANGAHGFLSKPYHEQSLIDCLEAALLKTSNPACTIAPLSARAAGSTRFDDD